MKKIKVFFIAAALLMTTAGVFAGSSKFFDTFALYGYNTSIGYKTLAQSVIIGAADEFKVATAGSTPASVTFNSLSYGVYQYDITTASYLPVQLK
jgi:hypothetical protein